MFKKFITVSIIYSLISFYTNFLFYFFFMYILIILLTTFYIFFTKKINFNNFFFFFINLYYILFILTLLVKFFYKNNSYFEINFIFLKYIFNSNFFLINFEVNNLSIFYTLTTIQITFFVNIFSFFYNKKDLNKVQFFFLLNLFSFFMVLLFFSKNFILLFFYWELIGIISYFLINFYFFKPFTFKSSLKALNFNKFSDFNFIMCIVIYYNTTNSFIINKCNIYFFLNNVLFYKFFFFKINSYILFLFFLFNCCFIKSAQFGYHYWLPDSMEAPLPASALIHSATLVAAGIFLVFKFNTLILFNKLVYSILLYYFSITFLFGSLVSCFQTDLKKILAYSTISNCGLIFLSLLFSSKQNSFQYFSYHGFFKSLSFIIAGQLIMIHKHKQDIRYFSLSNYSVFLKNSYIVISLLSLISIFFVNNSFIKHIILLNNHYNFFIKIILINSLIFSIFYSIRLVFFFKKKKINSKINKYIYFIFNFLIIFIFLIFILIFFVNISFFFCKYNYFLINKIILINILLTIYLLY